MKRGSCAVLILLLGAAIAHADTLIATVTPAVFQAYPGFPVTGKLVLQSSGGPINWRASVSTDRGGDWLHLGATAGTTLSTVPITIDPTGLAVGTYFATITLNSQTVQASLQVNTPVTGSIVGSFFRSGLPRTIGQRTDGLANSEMEWIVACRYNGTVDPHIRRFVDANIAAYRYDEHHPAHYCQSERPRLWSSYRPFHTNLFGQ
jgi:hypothetical protein